MSKRWIIPTVLVIAALSLIVSLGVSSDRLTTISYGEELPLCRDASEQCYARNRRVHFVPPSE